MVAAVQALVARICWRGTPHLQEAGWLRRLFGGDGVPKLVQKAILWGSLLLLVALAAAIVVNELRVAGLMRRLSSRRGRRAAAPAAARRRAPCRSWTRAGRGNAAAAPAASSSSRHAWPRRSACRRRARSPCTSWRAPPGCRTRLTARGSSCSAPRGAGALRRRRDLPRRCWRRALTAGRELLAAISTPASPAGRLGRRVRERLITLACALGALLLFATLFVRAGTAAARHAADQRGARRQRLRGAFLWLQGEGLHPWRCASASTAWRSGTICPQAATC